MWLQVVAAAAAIAVPLGLDLYIGAPEENPLTVERIELGRRLFFDRRLSADGRVSCASCHRPERAFSDGLPVAIGIGGRQGRRNSPALINRGYGRAFFWDARDRSLEEQVLRPIADPNEMGSEIGAAAARAGVTRTELSHGLASYVRSILSGNSRFDRFLDGESRALSPIEQQGLALFRGKGSCTACHVGPNFTDERVHNTGIGWRAADGTSLPAPADEGAGGGRFKTPTLRDIAHTAPYMHNGSLATLEDVVNFYDRGGQANPSLDEEMRPLRLTASERGALVSFLKALSGKLQEGAARRAP